MRIICVAGASSGVGKTTVACGMLRHLPGWAALKVTRSHRRDPCPHQKGCNVCATLKRPYRLLEMAPGKDVPGKDTWRLREAGASRVFWLIARPEAVGRGLKKALLKLKAAPGVVIEGNSAVPWVEADLVVMVRRRGGGEMSPSAWTAARHADRTIFIDESKPASSIELKCRRILRALAATPTIPGTRRS
jgi:molybdopterin-guanine dinucleotide biosynthesis protein